MNAERGTLNWFEVRGATFSSQRSAVSGQQSAVSRQRHASPITHHPSRITRYALRITCHSSLFIRHLSLVTRHLSLLLIVLLCLAFLVRTGLRNRDWVSNEALFRRLIQVVPDNAKAHALLGHELKNKPSPVDRERAVAAFRTALAQHSTLDPVLRELVRLKIAGLNACRY